jgi:RNA polymerase sigma-70 factor (ECF subfamily)
MAQDQGSVTRLTLLGRLRDTPNDQSAWTEFLARYEPSVLTWCRGFGLQDADALDVTQNVLLRLARKMKTFQYDPARSFRGWLKTLTRNAWKDLIEQRQRPDQSSGDHAVMELLANVQAGEGLVNCLKEQFDLEVLEEAKSRVQWRVEGQSWEAFRLTAMLNSPVAAVAEQLGMSVFAVYKAKRRVVQMLRDEVRRMEEEDQP